MYTVRSVSYECSTSRLGMKIIMLVIFALFSFSAYAGPKRTTYQAKINKPNGEPLVDASVNFRFTVINPAGNCTLYVESFPAVDMTNTGGIVALPLGSGTRVFPSSGTTSFSDVFDNTAGDILCMTSGGGLSTYAPGEVHDRKIVMQFQDQLGWQTLPAMSINAVPYANYADKAANSVRLNGKADTAFVERTSLPVCITGQALYFDGFNFSCVSASGTGSGTGTVTNVASSNSYITVSSGTATPLITLNVGTSVNTVAAGNDARILGAAQRANNLSDLASSATARSNLGLGSFATRSSLIASDVTAALGYVPAASGSAGVGGLSAINNLSDVASATVARINLGLGIFATRNSILSSDITSALSYTPANSATVATLQSDVSTLTTVASGKITSSAVSIAQVLGYVPAASGSAGVGGLSAINNLSDLASATVARNNLGLGSFSTRNSLVSSDVTTALSYTPANSATVTTAINTKITSSALSIAQVLGYVPAASGSAGVGGLSAINNLSDVASATVARINLGLGLFATRNSLLSSDITSALSYTPANSATVATLQTDLLAVSAVASSKITSSATSVAQVLGYTPANSATVTTAINTKITSSAVSIAQVLGYVPAASGSAGVGTLLSANNLSDVASATVARINLGLGLFATRNSLLSSDITSALSYTPANSATVATLQTDLLAVSAVASSKITSSAVSIAQVLGYVPAASGSAGVGTLLSVNNLSDVASATVARNNLGLGSFSTRNSLVSSDVTTALSYTPANSATVTTAINTKITSSALSIAQVLGYVPAASGSAGVGTLLSANNLSDVASATVARINLGLGLFATRNSLLSSDITSALSYTPANSATVATLQTDLLAVSAVASSKITSSAASVAQVLGYTPANSATVTTAINTKITSSAVSIAQVLGYVPAASGSAGVGTLLSVNNLSDVASATVARINLGLGLFATRNSLLSSDITSALSYTPANSATVATLQTDLLAVSAVASSKITSSAASVAQVLGYIPSNSATVTTAINTKITSSAASIAEVLGYVPANTSALGNYLLEANNLSDVASATVARTNLGLGSLATLNFLDLGSISASGTLAASKLADSGVIAGTYGKVTVDAKGRVTSGNALTNADIVTAVGYTPANSATVTTAINTKITSSAASIAQVLGYVPASATSLGNYLLEANNLSDLASATVARTNLGLGSLATLNFLDLGTSFASGTLAIARTPAYVGDVTKAAASNSLVLSPSGVTAGTYAKVTVDAKGRVTSGNALSSADVTTALGYTPANSATASALYLDETSNLSDLVSIPTARTNLGLGTVAVLNFIDLSTTIASGTLAAARLPAFSGDVTSTVGTAAMTVDGIRGRPVLATAPVSGQALAYNGSAWAPAALGDFEKDGSVAMTGQFQAIAGTAAAPGYTFSGDLNNGIFAPAADTVAVTTAGAERIRVTSSGNVGLGTTAPGGGTRVRVSGQIAPTSFSTTGAAIDWSGGNTATTSYDCALGSISFSDMNDGGAYTLAVTSTTTAQCNFSTALTGDGAATVAYRFLPANAARTATSHSIYSFQRIGNVIYVSWLTGF